MPADSKRKEARKRKFGAQAAESPADGAPTLELETLRVEGSPNKKIKRADAAEEKVEAHPPQKPQRFIVFIGNLPYSTTDAAIQTHFAKVHPKSIRHRTDKETGKSKGFAFLEFEGYDRMKTCLKLYHGSTFDNGLSPARKLNVELTAGGGGGKSKERKAKLRVKNERLNEQRKRMMVEEEKTNSKTKTEKLPKKKTLETYFSGVESEDAPDGMTTCRWASLYVIDGLPTNLPHIVFTKADAPSANNGGPLPRAWLTRSLGELCGGEKKMEMKRAMYAYDREEGDNVQ